MLQHANITSGATPLIVGQWVAAPTDDDQEAKLIGARIAARLAEIEMNKESLALAIGVTEDSVYRLLRGETVKRWVDLIQLARVLRTSPNELLGFSNGPARARLMRLLDAAFQGLGAEPTLARNGVQTFLEVFDKRVNPPEHLQEQDVLRIELALAKRQSGAR